MRHILISSIIVIIVFIFLYFYLNKEKIKVAQNLNIFKQVLLDIENNKTEANDVVAESVVINLINPRSGEKAGKVLEMTTEENIVYQLIELKIEDELEKESTYDIWLRDSSDPKVKIHLGQIDGLVKNDFSKLEFSLLRREHIYNEIILTLQADSNSVDEKTVVLKGVLKDVSTTTLDNNF